MRIIKVGGGAGINLAGLAQDLAADRQETLIVLGAHAERDRLLTRLGEQKTTLVSKSGMPSVQTDKTMIDAIAMAYTGLRATRFVETLSQAGVSACHLSGIDGGLIQARRRRGIRTEVDGRQMIVQDLSGKPFEVRLPLLRSLFELNILPVITIPVADERGCAVNADNDELVLLFQRAYSPCTVIQLIEAPGLLDDPQRPESLIPEVTQNDMPGLIEKAKGGMKRKLHAVNRMLQNGPVIFADGRLPRPLSQMNIGTRFTQEEPHAHHAYAQ